MWHVWGRKEIHLGFWWGKLQDTDSLLTLGIYRRRWLKLILKQAIAQFGIVWTGFIQLRIGTSGGLWQSFVWFVEYQLAVGHDVLLPISTQLTHCNSLHQLQSLCVSKMWGTNLKTGKRYVLVFHNLCSNAEHHLYQRTLI